MEVTTALLCDFAQIRERLLFVASGGVTRIMRAELPAPIGVTLALVIEMDQIEVRRPHELQIFIRDEDGAEIAKIEGALQIEGFDGQVGEKAQVPMVMDLRPVGVRKYGVYDIGIYIDSQHQHTMSFWVMTPDGS